MILTVSSLLIIGLIAGLIVTLGMSLIKNKGAMEMQPIRIKSNEPKRLPRRR